MVEEVAADCSLPDEKTKKAVRKLRNSPNLPNTGFALAVVVRPHSRLDVRLIFEGAPHLGDSAVKGYARDLVYLWRTTPLAHQRCVGIELSSVRWSILLVDCCDVILATRL